MVLLRKIVMIDITLKFNYVCYRRFVEKEMFESPEQVPEKHDLTFYPTVNDLQNHIHQAIKDIEAGILPTTAPTVSTNTTPSNWLIFT